MTLPSVLFQTGLISLVVSGLLLLIRVIEAQPEVEALQAFANSGWGLFLIIVLFLYGICSMVYGFTKIIKVLREE